MTNHIDLDTIVLTTGSHKNRDAGVCLLELAAWWAHENHSDHPQCVSPVLGTYGRSLNDVLPDDLRQQLKPFIPRLPGTAGDGHDETRGYLALDWLIRIYTPTWLRLVPALVADADLLAAHPPIHDLETAARVGDVVREAAAHASAARAAAWDAARAAAWDAARAAARDAAWDAARAAAWDAARAAAWDAAWAAARAAAWDALAPTVLTLQTSAIDLFDQLIDARVPAVA